MARPRLLGAAAAALAWQRASAGAGEAEAAVVDVDRELPALELLGDKACACDWEDNRWLYLIDDLLQVFGRAGAVAAGLAAAAGRNASEGEGPLRHLDGLVRQERLCRVEPSLLQGTNGVQKRFDSEWLEASFNASVASEPHADALKQLCLPGQIALDLLCSQAAGAFRGGGAEERCQVPAAGARRARRLGLLLPFVRRCLPTSVWPLDVAALKAYVSDWARGGTEAAASFTQVPVFAGPVQLPRRVELPPQLRRCLPLPRSQACWPRKATSLSQSCSRCCDPRYPRGDTACFAGLWTFEACCQPDDLEAGWAPAPPAAEELLPEGGGAEDGARELRELREELRLARRPPRPSPRSSPPGRATAWAELRRWLEAAREQPQGQQRLFPELDLLVSTKACVGPEVELPWFLAAPPGEAAVRSSVSSSRTASGVELAASAGAVCGPGLPVAGELVSREGRRATVPRGNVVEAEPSRHRLEPYGLELMRSCELTGGRCPCGGPWCDGREACCHEGAAAVEWRNLGLLTGELRTNIAHFARDALWLHLHLRGNASLAALAAGSRNASAARGPDLVLAKHAATECIENDRCVRTGGMTILAMESFMAEVALRGAWAQPQILHAGEPSRRHPICFEVAAQRWRPWAGDGHTAQSFRAKALQRCGVKDRGLQRKIVVLRRDSISRQWPDEAAVLRQLKALAKAVGSALHAVNLGQQEPCEQVAALHDAMLLLAVHGADLTNMLFLPRGAAVVEVAVECEVEGGSVDFPMWRGPGTLVNSSVYREAQDAWRRQSSEGQCPAAGATQEEWLQGYPVSQFAKLARQANLLYTALMDCSAAACDRKMGDVWDRGWCTSELKKRHHVSVDVGGRLIPTIWAIFDGYLRWRAPWES